MEYPLAIPFKNNNSYYNNRARELLIYVDVDKIDQEEYYANLDFFLENFSEKEISIILTQPLDEFFILQIEKLFLKYENFKLRLSQVEENIPFFLELQENDIPYYFGPEWAVGDYGSLYDAFYLGVSEIYIADDLMYDVENVSNICFSLGLDLRLVLNTIPSSAENAGSDIKSPIFPPQCRPYLDEYFTIYEFNCGGRYDYNWKHFKTLFRVWFISQYYSEDMRNINLDLEFELYPNYFIVNYIHHKLNCRRRCEDPNWNTKCDICQRIMNIYEKYKDAGAEIYYK